MSEPTSRLPLAHAFLALGDDGELPSQRSLPRVLVALVAAAALACATPAAWAASAATRHADQPVATLSSKPYGTAPAGDEDGG
jgi:uncharacterized membrane protein